ncbi:MAG: hypothetical protein ACLP8S_28745 [Solirubrobacteraceae bacterium]
MSSRRDAVLAELDVGHEIVRAVRSRVSDELRGLLAAGGTAVGDEIIEVRWGDAPAGQPVLGERPAMIVIDDELSLVFGLLPDTATSAEAVAPDGERVPCTVGLGIWMVVLPNNQLGAELYPVLFRDGAGVPVNPGLPTDWEREATGARELPCPACGANEWDKVTAAWEGTGPLRNTRWGYGPWGPGKAFVCRVCGHEERIGGAFVYGQH